MKVFLSSIAVLGGLIIAVVLLSIVGSDDAAEDGPPTTDVDGGPAIQLATADADGRPADENGGPDGNLLGVSNPLISDTRSRLSLCVDGAGGFNASDEDTQEVREALEQGLAAENSLPAEYAEPVVVPDCPPAPDELGAVRGTSLGIYGQSFSEGETPSEHRLFVYFIAPELFEMSWPGEPYGLGTAELACRADVCLTVTGSLYVSSSVSGRDLRDGLLDSLLLLPREPNPEPILDWEACERGEQPHPDYTCDQYEDWLD